MLEAITFVNVNKWYGDYHVLKDINLKINFGEKTVICGPSGSGKSTMIRCINCLEQYQTGTIIVNGKKVTDNSEDIKNIRRDVSMLFQQFNLFPHLTVLENLILGPTFTLRKKRSEAEEIAINYLVRFQMLEQASKFPNQLSGGQQQRVAIARALCMNPKIILFDEPTSALDPKMTDEVSEIILEMVEELKITILCITHEMNFAQKIADRIIYMNQGEILDDSKSKNFFNKER